MLQLFVFQHYNNINAKYNFEVRYCSLNFVKKFYENITLFFGVQSITLIYFKNYLILHKMAEIKIIRIFWIYEIMFELASYEVRK